MHKAFCESLKTAGISQAELARRIGISAGMVWQWANGIRPIAAEKVIPIVLALDGNVNPHQLRPDIYPADLDFRPLLKQSVKAA